MSVHKVPQDVEAEDKLVGPFSFKQMVLLMIAAFIAFIMFLLSRISVFLIAFPMPIFLIFLFFGIYRRKDQSVETYTAALLRFYIKPRKRIWDKDGVLETVQITAPKIITGPAIDNMTNMEVKNRLKALGQLMDTRGWSAKNASLQDGAMAMSLAQSDRLVAPMSYIEPSEVHDSDDILDDYSGASQKIAAQTKSMQDRAREAAMEKMRQQRFQPPDVQPTPVVAAPTPPAQQQAVVADTPAQAVPTFSPMPTSIKQNVVQPMASTTQPVNAGSTTSQAAATDSKSSSLMTTDVPADIIGLSQNNDRSIESIAKEADSILESGDTISLHGH